MNRVAGNGFLPTNGRVDNKAEMTYNSLKHIAKKGKPAERRWRKATGLQLGSYDRRATVTENGHALGSGDLGRFFWI